VQAPRADIFRVFVYFRGEAGQGRNRVFGEGQLQAFGIEQRNVLLYQRVLWLGKNTNKVGFGERAEFDANRKAALKLGDQIGRLGRVERTRCDEKNWSVRTIP
jgi:hypothetical protein